MAQLCILMPLGVKTPLCLLPGHLCGFDFIATATGPTRGVWKHFTVLSFQARIHVAPPLLNHNGSFNTRRLCPSCAGHLTWETGTLDCLGALLYAVFIAAAVHSDHLTRTLLDQMVTCVSPEVLARGGHQLRADH